jgi:hypothetical protein
MVFLHKVHHITVFLVYLQVLVHLRTLENFKNIIYLSCSLHLSEITCCYLFSSISTVEILSCTLRYVYGFAHFLNAYLEIHNVATYFNRPYWYLLNYAWISENICAIKFLILIPWSYLISYGTLFKHYFWCSGSIMGFI